MSLFWLHEPYNYKEEALNRGPGPLRGTEVLPRGFCLLYIAVVVATDAAAPRRAGVS